MGDAFMHTVQEQYHQQQAQSLPSPATQDVSSSQPTTTTNNQGILSQETIVKIQELKRLVSSYPQYCPNADAFIKSIIYFCNDGNNMFLDEKLEQLRMFNNLMK
jgi:hypothetical protein